MTPRPVRQANAGDGELAVSEHTEGHYALLEGEFPADHGMRIPRHVHRDCDEAFYVLHGQLTVSVEDAKHSVGAGSLLLVPRGATHTIGNESAGEVRFLMLFSPGAWSTSSASRRLSTGAASPRRSREM